MVPFLLALTFASPWAHPLAFDPIAGWQTGSSGTTRSVYAGRPTPATAPLEATAWLAKNVRYLDRATADPPNRTLAHLRSNGMIVWAVIFSPVQTREQPIRLDFGRAKHFACCEAERVAGGEYELAGAGPGGVYSVIVRIYLGSRATGRLRAQAQLALDQIRLPSPR